MARAVRDGGSPWKRTAFRCIAVLAAIVLAAGGMQGFAVTASAEDMAGRTESMDGGGSTGQSGDVDDGTGAGVKTGGSDDISEPLFTEDFEGIAQDESASDGTRLQDYRSSWNGQDVRYAADGDRPNPEGCGDLRQPGTPGRGAADDRRPLRPGLAGRRHRHRRRDAVGRSLMRHMAHEAPANSVAAPMPVPPASQSRPERPPVIGSTPTWGTRLTKVTAAFGVRPVTVGGVPDILPVPRGSVVLQPGTVRSGFVLGDSFEILGEERLRYIIGAAGLHPCTGAVIDVTGLAGRAAPIHAFGSTGHVFSRGRDGESLHAAGRQYDRRQHRDAPKGRTLPRGTPVSHRSRHFRAPPCICSSPDSTTGDASPRNHDIHHP